MVEVASASANPGDTVTLDVTVRNITDPKGLGAYQLHVKYPEQLVKLIEAAGYQQPCQAGVQGGNPPFDAVPVTNCTNDAPARVEFGSIHTTKPGPTGNIVIARLVFLVVGSPGSVATLDLLVASPLPPPLGIQNTDSEPILPVSDVDGAITILGAPTATPTATATPLPTPTMTPVPTALTVVKPEEATTVTVALGALAQVSVLFPAQIFSETKQVAVRDVPLSELPAPLPAEVGQVTRLFEISVYNAQGIREGQPNLNQCATVSVDYTSDDTAAAGGNPFSLRLLRYDSALRLWIVLNTQVAVAARELRAQVCGTLSTFGVGVEAGPAQATPAPPPTQAPLKPPVGDASPSSTLLAGLLAAGVPQQHSAGWAAGCGPPPAALRRLLPATSKRVGEPPSV